jgi:hypothetical protein
VEAAEEAVVELRQQALKDFSAAASIAFHWVLAVVVAAGFPCEMAFLSALLD